MVILNSDGINGMANISRGRRPLVRGGLRNIGNRGERHPLVHDELRNEGNRGGRRLLVRGGLRNLSNRGRISTSTAEGSVLRAALSALPRGIMRIPNPVASTASQQAPSVSVRFTSRVTISEPLNQSEIYLATLDPTNFGVHALYNTLSTLNPRPRFRLMAEMLMRYTLNIRGLPPCPEEDLMLAVFLFLEENLKVSYWIIDCVKYTGHQDGQEQVGVVYETIQIVEEILRIAGISLRESAVRIERNTNPDFILAVSASLGSPTIF